MRERVLSGIWWNLETRAMSVMLWLILGAIVGWLSGLIVRVSDLGVVGAILVGMLGGVLGGGIVSLFAGAGVADFSFWSLAVAVVGAIVLLLIAHLFTSDSRRAI